MCATALVIGAAASLASAGVGVMGAMNAKSAADSQTAMIAQQQQAIGEENHRLAVEAMKKAGQEETERVKASNKELGTIFAAAGEMGISNLAPFVVETGYNTGTDVGRIYSAAENEQERLAAMTRTSQLGSLQQIDSVINSANATVISGLGQALGAGLDFSGQYTSHKEAARKA